MITNILAYIDGRGSMENAAEAAFQLADRHGAQVEGLHVRAAAQDFITDAPFFSGFAGIEAIETFTQSCERAAREIEQQAAAAFARVRDRHGVGAAAASPPPAGARWSAVTGRAENIVAQRARVADVCVVGRSRDGWDSSTNPVIEALLFDSGRPLLTVPIPTPKAVGANIVIAWNRAAAAARALNSAMPLFDKAERICLVYVNTGAKQGPSVEAAAAYVERHGFAVDVKILSPHSQGVGPTLLRYAHTQNIGLLVMGAYSHSRLHNVVHGGVTRYVLENAAVPVLMVH